MDDSKRKSDTRSRKREPGRYANVFQIGYNAAEFLFEFGQEAGGIHTRVYTSPQHAHILSALLSRSLQEHEEAFGPIVGPNPRDT